MSDSRWSDVEADVEQALKHFGMAIGYGMPDRHSQFQGRC